MRIDTFHLNLVKTYNFFLYNEQTSFLWEREREEKGMEWEKVERKEEKEWRREG